MIQPSKATPDPLAVQLEQMERHLMAGRRFVHECAATNTFYQFQSIRHELYYDPEQPEHLRFHVRCTAGGERMNLWKSGDESLRALLTRMPLDLRKFRMQV